MSGLQTQSHMQAWPGGKGWLGLSQFLCSWREPHLHRGGRDQDHTGCRTNAHWKENSRPTGTDCGILPLLTVSWGERITNRSSRENSLALSESPRVWALACHLWGVLGFRLNSTIQSAEDWEFQHEPPHFNQSSLCCWPCAMSQSILWQGTTWKWQAATEHLHASESTSCSPPKLDCFSWSSACPGEAWTIRCLSQRKHRWWMGCHLWAAESGSD